MTSGVTTVSDEPVSTATRNGWLPVGPRTRADTMIRSPDGLKAVTFKQGYTATVDGSGR